MKSFDAETLARFEAGEIDYIDAVTLVFDSGAANFYLGGQGSFAWTDAGIGTQTFYGTASLIDIEVPPQAAGAAAEPVVLRLYEAQMVEGSDTPVNVFDDGIRTTIDEAEWEGRDAILSMFWRRGDGSIIEREQVTIRVMDAAPVEWDEQGNPVRSLYLEEPDITQRDIEGRTGNAAFQALIDPTDRGLEHVGTVRTERINFGRIADAQLG